VQHREKSDKRFILVAVVERDGKGYRVYIFRICRVQLAGEPPALIAGARRPMHV